MTCPSCQAAQAQPNAAQFSPGCLSCEARAMAVTRADLLEDYTGAAKRMFGDRAKEGHALVKEWLQRIKANRSATLTNEGRRNVSR